jgi:outer membrane beta-barrel protein
MQAKRILVTALSTLALTGALAADAHAERGRNPLAGQPAIRHRLELRKMRFEVTPQFLVSANQSHLLSLGGGLNAQFHITDWLGVAASFHYTGNLLSPLGNQVMEGLPWSYDQTLGTGQPSKRKFLDHLVGADMLIGLYGTLTPIGGKFSLFNALVANYDFYLIAGIGMARLTTPLLCANVPPAPSGVTPDTSCTYKADAVDINAQSSDNMLGSGIQVAGVFGIGTHLFFNDWMALQVELRDYVFKSNPGGLDVNTTDSGKKGVYKLTPDDLYVTSNLYFGVGLSFFLPPKAKVPDRRDNTATSAPSKPAAVEEPAAAPPAGGAEPAPAQSK